MFPYYFSQISHDFSLTQIFTTGFYTLWRCFAVSCESEIQSLNERLFIHVLSSSFLNVFQKLPLGNWETKCQIKGKK
jgi:hypothetical protein